MVVFCLTAHAEVRPRIEGRPPRGQAAASIAKVYELEGRGKFTGAQGSDHGLEFISALGRYPDIAALNLCGHLEFLLSDETSDLFGHGLVESLLDFDFLSASAQR